MSDVMDAVSPEDWLDATQLRIDAQVKIVGGLTPGSEAHKISTSVLLLLQDSLFVLSQTKMIVETARRQAPVPDTTKADVGR